MFRFFQGVVATLAIVVLCGQGRNSGHLKVTKLEIVDKKGNVLGIWEGHNLIVLPKKDDPLDEGPKAFVARGGKVGCQSLVAFGDIEVADKQLQTRARMSEANFQLFDAKQKRVWKARR